MPIGDHIRDLRWARRLKQGELADRAGIAQNTLSQIELGKTTPSVPTLEKIARALSLDLSELLLEEPVQEREHWEKILASVRERQRDVEAKVGELVALPAHSKADLYQVKWALDEAQGCEVDLLLAPPGSRRVQDKIIVEIDPLTVDVDQFEEWLQESEKAKRFYDGIAERLVEAGLAEWKERAGEKAEAVPLGIGA
jgi:transcriptional regulator with XRE-family HTH domain